MSDVTVEVRVPAPLRRCCGGASSLTLRAETVQHVLDELERAHPELHRSVCQETGAVRPHVNLFVNAAQVRKPDGLGTRLADGDVVTIFPAVSGG